MSKHIYDCVGGPLSPYGDVSHDRRRGVKRLAAMRHSLETCMSYTRSLCNTCKAKKSRGLEGERKWGERVEGWVVKRACLEGPEGVRAGRLVPSPHLPCYFAAVMYHQAAVIYCQAY